MTPIGILQGSFSWRQACPPAPHPHGVLYPSGHLSIAGATYIAASIDDWHSKHAKAKAKVAPGDRRNMVYMANGIWFTLSQTFAKVFKTVRLLRHGHESFAVNTL
jgi:membrane-associated phospholipid phosphatase